MLTKKLLMLMALLAGVRGQLLYLIDVKNMTITYSTISFRIAEITKTTRPGKHVGELRFTAYPCDRRLDVVHYAKVYLERTLDTRWTVKQFFLCYGKFGCAASRDTIRRWLKEMLDAAGIDMDIFRPHSTRSASTSAASTCVSMETILRTAGWTNPSTFQRYYKKPIIKTCAFQESLMRRFRKH